MTARVTPVLDRPPTEEELAQVKEELNRVRAPTIEQFMQLES